MAIEYMDLTGLKCPEPAVKIATKMLPLKPGTIIEAKADCETFENDVRGICQRWKKVLLSVKQQGKVKTVQIQV